MRENKVFVSLISGKQLNHFEAYQGKMIRPGVFSLIKKEYPAFGEDSYIGIDELAHFRKLYLNKLINKETGDLNRLEQDVLKAITENKILSENIEINLDDKFTFGQKIADKIADFGGSWSFIFSFFLFILLWIGGNLYILTTRAFDPFPFILLNLILSCLAAIQAPVIMMSQNRKESKDRMRNEHDFKVNLKAELEIRLLHEKLDHLMMHQNNRIMEIQELQTDYLVDISARLKNNK